MPAIGAALGVAALILVWRLIRRESLQPAISGFFAVGVSALIAYLVGESKGYFLLGIWSSLVYAGVFALSVLIRRPVVGYVWGWVNGRDRDWRERAPRRAAPSTSRRCVWALVFGARFLVQNRLYDDDQTGSARRRAHRDGLAADRPSRRWSPTSPSGPRSAPCTRPTDAAQAARSTEARAD